LREVPKVVSIHSFAGSSNDVESPRESRPSLAIKEFLSREKRYFKQHKNMDQAVSEVLGAKMKNLRTGKVD